MIIFCFSTEKKLNENDLFPTDGASLFPLFQISMFVIRAGHTLNTLKAVEIFITGILTDFTNLKMQRLLAN